MISCKVKDVSTKKKVRREEMMTQYDDTSTPKIRNEDIERIEFKIVNYYLDKMLPLIGRMHRTVILSFAIFTSHRLLYQLPTCHLHGLIAQNRVANLEELFHWQQ
jgi:hypothetical protein